MSKEEKKELKNVKLSPEAHRDMEIARSFSGETQQDLLARVLNSEKEIWLLREQESNK